MSAPMLAPCREVKNLLPLFFDSELDARQMRLVALHSAKCAGCERELRSLEGLQEAISQSIGQRVDQIDLDALWPAVDRRLGSARPSWLDRVRVWWEEREPSSGVTAPLLGAATAAVAIGLAVLWSPGSTPDVAQAPPPVAMARPVSIDSIDAATNVALLNEEDTLVLWVEDEFATVSLEGLP